MPLRTDNEVWQTGTVPDEYLRERTRNFLREHHDRAFRVRELSDMMMGTNLDCIHGDGTAELFADGQALTRLLVFLDELADENVVELRRIPSNLTDSPFESGQEVAVTYIGT